MTDNVIFYGQKPLEEMPGLYKIADAMLVTLEGIKNINYFFLDKNIH